MSCDRVLVSYRLKTFLLKSAVYKNLYLKSVQGSLFKRGTDENNAYCGGVVLYGPVYPKIDL